MKLAILSLLALFIILPMAHADVVRVLQGVDCGFNATSTLTCSNAVYAQCNVTDTNGGSPEVQVVGVKFTVNQRDYDAVLVSGNVTSGVWRAKINQTFGDTTMTINRVALLNSIGWSCQFSPSVTNPLYQSGDPYSCFISFQGKPISVPGNCTCETYKVISRVPGGANRCTTTWTPSVGCVGGQVFSSETYCNWCDPDWRVAYGVCSTDRNAANPFLGTAIKYYTPRNDSCCNMTGLPEDCNPPADDDKPIACVVDHYSTGGGNVETTNHAQQGSGVTDMDSYLIAVDSPAQPYGLVLKPLSFDVQGDGKTELMVFETIGVESRVKIFNDPRLSGYSSTFVPTINGNTVQWMGQPSLFGFSSWGDKQYAWNDDLKAKTVGIGIAAVVKDSFTNDYYFGAWRYEGGQFVLKRSLLLGTTSPGTGVTCFVDDCFLLENDGTMRYINALGNVGVYGVAQASRTVGYSAIGTPLNNLPALISFNNSASRPTAVVVEGMSSGGASGVYVCPMDLTSNVSCSSKSLTGISIGAPTHLVVSNMSWSFPGYVDVYVATNDGSLSKLWTMRVDGNLSINSWSSTLSSIGGTSDCVSDPALAKCIGGLNGVAVASHWVSPSGNSTGYNEYSCYVGGTSKSFGWTQREEYCPGSIATAELVDGSSAIVSPSGIFGYNQHVASFAGATSKSVAVVQDMTSSTYTGVITLSETLLRNMVSRIPVQTITTSEALSIGSVDCVFDVDSETVIATAYGVTAPFKNRVQFQAAYVTDTGETGSDISSFLQVRRLPARTTGTYTVTVRALDTVSKAQVEKSCSVGAVVQTPEKLPAVCTLGDNNIEGSFNFVDTTVEKNGWVLGANTQTLLVNGNYLVFKQTPGYQGQLLHPLTCDYQRLRAEVKLRPPQTSDTGATTFSVMARSFASTSSAIVPMGMVTVVKSDAAPFVTVYAQSSTGDFLVYASNSSTMKWMTIGVSVDRLTSKMAIDVTPEGENMTGPLEYDVKNVAAGQFAGIMVGGSNEYYLDYVKVTTLSGISIASMTEAQKVRQSAAVRYLKNDPNDATVGCQDIRQAEGYNKDSRLTFDHVNAYCNSVANTADHQNNPGYCTFSDLQEIVMVNSNCYLEAYAYCVNVTYSKTAGFSDSGLKSLTNTQEIDMSTLPAESAGGEGAGVCMSTLGISVVMSRQALPFMNVMWGLLADYWVYALVLIVAIIIIGGMGGGGEGG